jgi:CRP-like cAMP-binding protein
MAIAPRSPEDLLRDVTVLKDLPSADLKQLADAGEIRKVVRGAPLFSEGKPAEGLFVVRTGELKVTTSGREGREQILYLARPGRVIVEGVRFDHGEYPASAVAMREASVVLFTNDVLIRLGNQRSTIYRALLDVRARRADRTLSLVSDLSLRTVPARLASFLCTLVAMREALGKDSQNLVRDLTTETVAGRLEISRGLASLEKQGALSVSPDLIEVVDLARLEEIAYGPKKQ